MMHLCFQNWMCLPRFISIHTRILLNSCHLLVGKLMQVVINSRLVAKIIILLLAANSWRGHGSKFKNKTLIKLVLVTVKEDKMKKFRVIFKTSWIRLRSKRKRARLETLKIGMLLTMTRKTKGSTLLFPRKFSYLLIPLKFRETLLAQPRILIFLRYLKAL